MAWSPILAYAQDVPAEDVYIETDVDVSEAADGVDLEADAADRPPIDEAPDSRLPTTEPDPSATPIALPSTEEGGSGVTPQAISLPDAEGSVEGMGESFSPVLSSGTATFSVPIAVAPGRAGVQPSLALSYATTGGNGPVGFGWNLGVPFISRQTDRGMPRYQDRLGGWHAEEDRFIYNGGQELVPVDNATVGIVDQDAATHGDAAATTPSELSGWQQYRARVEGGFMRFFRSPDYERWVVQSMDGTRFEFGRLSDGAPGAVTASEQAVERDPEVTGTGGIARWCLTRMSDAHGSTVYYVYDQDDGRSYLRDVYYVSPHAECAATDPAISRACNAPLDTYGARVRFSYDTRQDVFAGYTTGWRIGTARRLRRIEVSAYDETATSRTRVRRYHLGYDPSSFHSLLAEVQVEGRPQDCSLGYCVGDTSVPEGSGVAGERLPPMTFEYSAMPDGATASAQVPGFGGISTDVRSVENSPPHSVDDARSDLFDVNSDGLPDLIVTDPARYRTDDGRPAVGVFFNGFTGRRATPAGAAATFSDAVPMAVPYGLDTTMSLGNANVVPMDIDGDGRGDLLHMPRLRDYGWFAATRRGNDALSPADQGWEWTYASVQLPASDTDPRIDLGRDGRHIRVLDVNNDHLIDVVRTTGTVMQTWLNLGWLPGGEGRFGSYRWTGTEWSLSTAPYESCLLQGGLPIDFEDPEVRLGDMNGDGLQDIVQLRRGRVIYWPGRGEGVWGTGSRTCARAEGAGRYIEMATPPAEVNPDLDGVYLSDVDMDGTDDLVQVRFREVDVWFNEAGQGWTGRTTARNTPAAPAFAPRVRFSDIDGSATTDIVWANAGRWEYVDPTGGQRPRLLTQVHNGLGAETTISYGSSAQDYLADLAEAESGDAWEVFDWSAQPNGPDVVLCELSDRAGSAACLSSDPDEWLVRSTGSPVVSTVVRAVSTSDRFDVLGREAQVSESQFAYHDGYYEGIEQEFRGFGAADAVTVGDWNNPTVYSRTRFLQGRRPTAVEGDRLAHNPNEALKGREFMTEVFDDEGAFLSTSFATMANRYLTTGLDGRPIHYAYVLDTNELRYDSAPFVPGSATLELDAVVSEAADPSTGDVGGQTVERTRTISVRADVAHTSRVQSYSYNVTNVGGMRTRRDYGEVDVLTGGKVDDRILRTSSPTLMNDAGQWIWRPYQQYVQDLGHPEFNARFQQTISRYEDDGDLDYVTGLHGALIQSHDFDGDPANEGGAAAHTHAARTQYQSHFYDEWGQSLATCAGTNIGNATSFPSGCLRYGRTTYDATYHQTVELERIYTGRGANEWLESTGTWDRGLGAIVSATDPAGLTSRVTHDGLGRLTSVTPPNVDGCTGEHVATHIHYALTSDPAAQPISTVRSVTELGCDGVGTGDRLESIAFVDGLGRARASLSTNGVGSAWVRSGMTTLDKKGTVRRSYQSDFFDDSESDYAAVVALPTTPYAVVRYDAFGRTRGVIAEDGSSTWTSYHSLSSDVCDPLDNAEPGPGETSHFYQTCTTTVVDGHGRTIDQILRNRQPDSTETETYHLWSYYRADNSLIALVRANGDGTPRPHWYTGTLPSEHVVRRFEYDKLSRRVTSYDLDTDDPQGATGSSSWRYLYNEVNDLIAVRDPRGCGQNFFYDHAGRLRGEQYVSCGEAQTSRAEQPPSDNDVSGLVAWVYISGARSLDVVYHYDTNPSWATMAPAGPTAGRATGVSDRGQRAAIAYDDRGNAVWTGRQLALIPDALAFSSENLTGARPSAVEAAATTADVAYDELHTYVRTATFDHAGRALTITLPADPDHAGTAPVIGGALDYDTRGLPSEARATIDGAPQIIVEDIEYDANGLVTLLRYGDTDDGTGSGMRTATLSTTQYDVRLRPVRMTTARQATGPSGLDAVTEVVDQVLVWDAANNLVGLDDQRDGSEWPAGHLPQSVAVQHDALYRVTHADYSYNQPGGGSSPIDDGSDWRDDFGAAHGSDPMRQVAAPMASTPPSGTGTRVIGQTWSWDYLANQTETSDDASVFYERSVGAIINGDDTDDTIRTRPSALYFAQNFTQSPAPSVGQAGWLEADYGRGGNLVAMTVHAQCHQTGAPASICTVNESSPLATQMSALQEGCECESEQHYVYRWDELNRLAEARRYDRSGGTGSWTRAVRQRYRYDGANQRTIKQTLEQDTSSCSPTAAPGQIPCERVALYVYPGDFERRGLVSGVSSYDASPELGTETQYVVAGARMVFRTPNTSSDAYERDERIVVPLSDLIHTTSAAFDVRTGRLVEASTYYPSGGRETLLADASAAAEPSGFTGKEADEEVGVVYFGERYLVPRIGRWASPDPLHVHAVGGGEALNSYHYVSGNLLAARDALGLDPCDLGGCASLDQYEGGETSPHPYEGGPSSRMVEGAHSDLSNIARHRGVAFVPLVDAEGRVMAYQAINRANGGAMTLSVGDFESLQVAAPTADGQLRLAALEAALWYRPQRGWEQSSAEFVSRMLSGEPGLAVQALGSAWAGAAQDGDWWMSGATAIAAGAPVDGLVAASRAGVGRLLSRLGGTARTGTVWDDVLATQPNYPGSVIPRSFELQAGSERVWVHGNATEHIAELAAARARLYAPDYVRLLSQQSIRSLQAAVEAATESGVPYGQLVNVGGWELRFGAPAAEGQLPVLFHAQPL